MSKNGEAVKMRKKIDIIIIFGGLLFLAIGILASCLCIHTVKSTYDFFIKAGKTEACIVDITFWNIFLAEDHGRFISVLPFFAHICTFVAQM